MTTIFRDTLLRSSVVVEHADAMWLVPRVPSGWQRRQRLTLTPAARSKRLKPGRDVDAGWLGIAAENKPQDCPRTRADGVT
jgi:hypothetical protein